MDECIISEGGKFSTLVCQAFLETAEDKKQSVAVVPTQKKIKLTELEQTILDSIKREKSKQDFLINCTTQLNKEKKWNTYDCIKFRKNILNDR